ncbi:MAG: hypothetical protein QQN63_04460, partial [Nitrosopumilus sp.]
IMANKSNVDNHFEQPASDSTDNVFNIDGTARVSGAIAIASGGAITVESSGAINIESGAAVNVESGGAVTVESGGDITVDSGATVTMDGGMTVQTGGDLTVDSGGTMFMDGALRLNAAVLGSDGVQSTAIADATDAASAITQLNLALAAMQKLGLIAT